MSSVKQRFDAHEFCNNLEQMYQNRVRVAQQRRRSKIPEEVPVRLAESVTVTTFVLEGVVDLLMRK